MVTISDEQPIQAVEYEDENGDIIKLTVNQKNNIAIDEKFIDYTNYTYKVLFENGEEKQYSGEYQIPKIQGNYKLSNGIYVNEPKLAGFNPNYTRYMNLSDSGDYMVPGNWIKTDSNGCATNYNEGWYDYKNSKWANIYVEDEGMETNYVWIPRYCYKLDKTNQRSDIKFIDINNRYKDADGNVTEWKDLLEQGYNLPEAFIWRTGRFDIETQIPGYWISKYQLNDVTTTLLDFNIEKTDDLAIKISNITIDEDTKTNIAKFTYAINGNIIGTVNITSVTETTEWIINEDKVTNDNYVNITALNSNGEILASMTKNLKIE